MGCCCNLEYFVLIIVVTVAVEELCKKLVPVNTYFAEDEFVPVKYSLNLLVAHDVTCVRVLV